MNRRLFLALLAVARIRPRPEPWRPKGLIGWVVIFSRPQHGVLVTETVSVSEFLRRYPC